MEDIHALENIESNQQQPQGLQQVHQLDQIQNMEQVHQVPQISHVQHTDHVQQVQQTVEVPVVMDDDGEHVPPSQSEVQVNRFPILVNNYSCHYFPARFVRGFQDLPPKI